MDASAVVAVIFIIVIFFVIVVAKRNKQKSEESGSSDTSSSLPVTIGRGKNSGEEKYGTLVISPGTSSDAKDSKTDVKPVERVTVYKWNQLDSVFCCPNCEAEIKNNEKKCKACGWIIENR